MTIRRTAFLVGRAIFGGYFLYNGVNHFRHRQMMAEYAGSKGVAGADAAVTTTGAMLLAGGTSLLTGAAPRLGLATIIAFLAGVTPQMHRFWEETDPQQRMGEQVNFLKNAALLGACLMLMNLPDASNDDAEEFEFDLEVEPEDPVESSRLLSSAGL